VQRPHTLDQRESSICFTLSNRNASFGVVSHSSPVLADPLIAFLSNFPEACLGLPLDLTRFDC
jgi:hypothetical protein